MEDVSSSVPIVKALLHVAVEMAMCWAAMDAHVWVSTIKFCSSCMCILLL